MKECAHLVMNKPMKKTMMKTTITLRKYQASLRLIKSRQQETMLLRMKP